MQLFLEPIMAEAAADAETAAPEADAPTGIVGIAAGVDFGTTTGVASAQVEEVGCTLTTECLYCCLEICFFGARQLFVFKNVDRDR